MAESSEYLRKQFFFMTHCFCQYFSSTIYTVSTTKKHYSSNWSNTSAKMNVFPRAHNSLSKLTKVLLHLANIGSRCLHKLSDTDQPTNSMVTPICHSQTSFVGYIKYSTIWKWWVQTYILLFGLTGHQVSYTWVHQGLFCDKNHFCTYTIHYQLKSIPAGKYIICSGIKRTWVCLFWCGWKISPLVQMAD